MATSNKQGDTAGVGALVSAVQHASWIPIEVAEAYVREAKRSLARSVELLKNRSDAEGPTTSERE